MPKGKTCVTRQYKYFLSTFMKQIKFSSIVTLISFGTIQQLFFLNCYLFIYIFVYTGSISFCFSSFSANRFECCRAIFEYSTSKYYRANYVVNPSFSLCLRTLDAKLEKASLVILFTFRVCFSRPTKFLRVVTFVSK